MNRTHTLSTRRSARTGLGLLSALTLLTLAPPSHAATSQRAAIDDHGDFALFGNTVGFDCRDGKVEKPVVGSVPTGLLGLFSCNGLLPDSDTGVDIFWRSDYPGNAQATASSLIDISAARSTAVLSLPAGAKVLMARLYWAAQRSAGLGAGSVVSFERPGLFSRMVQAQSSASKVLSLDGLDYYQSSADVTAEVQAHGSGAYRVGNIQTVDLRSRDRNVAFVAWNIVVFYHLDSAPVRNLALFDGLERVSTGAGSTTNVSLSGFSVPANGFGAKLGIIAYEGDDEITGDQLLVNGSAVSNSYNPTNNFFNRSSTVLNQLAPRVGDLPQMSGRPSSMSGFDSDVIDITGRLSPGATQLSLAATTSGDEYFLGVFATSISTIRPVLSETHKTVVNLSRSDGRNLPGDTLEYTITTRNSGNDTGKQVVVTDALPAGIRFVPGSIAYTSGAGIGSKTDASGDDQAEYDAATRTITARLGSSASASMGGDLAVGASAALRFRATIDSSAQGTILNQANIRSLGETAQSQGVTTPTTWLSGDGASFQVATPVVLSTCSGNSDCSASAPICDTTATPSQCVCRNDSDCGSGRICNPVTRSCVECIVGLPGPCSAQTSGSLCLPSGSCGCMTSSDCGGRACDPVLRICEATQTDLAVSLSRRPQGGVVPPGSELVYNLTVTNKGSSAVPGARLDAAATPTMDLSWTCVGQGGAVCPATQGSGAIATSVSLPAGGSLLYTLRLHVGDVQASRPQDFNAVIVAPAGTVDVAPADNIASDSVLVGMLPQGPDLQVSVQEDVSTQDSSVTYVIDVRNLGPETAAGATLSYDVPPNTQVQIEAGEGWSCARTADGAQVLCSRTQPIPVGAAPPIRLLVTAPQDGEVLPLKVTVQGADGQGTPLADPNPADNTVDRTTTLSRFRLEGGGLVGCSYAPATGSSAQPVLGGTLLLWGLALTGQFLRRTRRSRPGTAPLA